jgi:peptide/nickel transport system permease protein
MKSLLSNARDILRYPSAVAGLAIIAVLVLISIYAIVAIPYAEATRLWRGGEEIWYKTPKNAHPEWTNLFREKKLPRTMDASSKDGSAQVVYGEEKDGVRGVTVSYTFDYPYDAFPQELSLYMKGKFAEKPPFASISWLTPDGRKIQLKSFTVGTSEVYRLSQDASLTRKLKGVTAEQGLFADPKAKEPKPLKGQYKIQVDGVTFEKDSSLDVEFVLYGQVFGLAGTDHQRRDLMVALLWGTPIALAFGLLAALGTTALTMIISAAGTWFGGWVDELIQRITEVNLVLPFLPILIMVGTFYSRSIWVILGVTIVLSIFSNNIKTFRAIFMQVKESPYIEAAKAYGASNVRIIFNYVIPPIIPLLIPQLVVLIPSYVFLEASLAVLGLGDPILPTWGKVINDAYFNGALFQGYYYWILEPSLLLMVTGLAFAILGFSLDRIFNPKLRGL